MEEGRALDLEVAQCLKFELTSKSSSKFLKVNVELTNFTCVVKFQEQTVDVISQVYDIFKVLNFYDFVQVSKL